VTLNVTTSLKRRIVVSDELAAAGAQSRRLSIFSILLLLFAKNVASCLVRKFVHRSIELTASKNATYNDFVVVK